MLVSSPSVTVIATTQIEADAIVDWADDHGLSETVNKLGTPLRNVALLNEDNGENLIEFGGRHCYRSWNVGRDSAAYMRNLIDEGHTSVLEHANISFAISGVSRTLTHELIRHRVGVAISQESQRYVDAKDMRFVVPPLLTFLDDESLNIQFEERCAEALDGYVAHQEVMRRALERHGLEGRVLKKRVNEAARAVLPGAAETRLLWTANYRILRHFFDMRGQDGADLEIRRLACVLFDHCTRIAPLVFDDFERVDGALGVDIVRRREIPAE